MTVISENVLSDFDLGIEGFKFSDLFEVVKLKELAEAFYNDVKSDDPVLSSALTKYIASKGIGYEPKVRSKILTDSAPYLSQFVARLFKIDAARSELGRNSGSKSGMEL